MDEAPLRRRRRPDDRDRSRSSAARKASRTSSRVRRSRRRTRSSPAPATPSTTPAAHPRRRRDALDADDRGERLPRRLRVDPADVLERAKMMFLSYPNNPTSAIATERVLRPRDRVRQGARPPPRPRQRLLRDRLRRLPRRRASSSAPAPRTSPSSCSAARKAYNMTGWRVAFACGNAQAIKALGTVKTNIDSGVFTAVQDAAIEAFSGPQDDDRRAVRAVPAPPRPRHGRARQDRHPGAHAEGHHLRLGEGARRLHLGRLRDAASSSKANVIVAAGHRPTARDGEGYIRISLTTPDDRLDEAIERIKSGRSRGAPAAHERRPSGSTAATDHRDGASSPPAHRAVLVVARPAAVARTLAIEESLAELERLADTAGADVVADRDASIATRPNPRTFIGPARPRRSTVSRRSSRTRPPSSSSTTTSTPPQQANLEDSMPRHRRASTAPRSSSTSSPCTP